MLLWNSNSPSSYSPRYPRHPPNPTSLSTLTGGVISAFVVEYYYFRERPREGLKDRQYKIEGEETKTKNRHLKWGWVSADIEFEFNIAAHPNIHNIKELYSNSGITKTLRSHKVCHIFSKVLYFIIFNLHGILFTLIRYKMKLSLACHESTCPSIHLWRYIPFRALASLTRCLHSSLFAALLLHPLVPSSCSASLWTTSVHLVLGLPTGLVLRKFPFRTFFGIHSFSILIIWPAHSSLLILMSSTIFCSLYKLYSSLFHLGPQHPPSCVGPYILRNIFLSNVFSICFDVCVKVQVTLP